MREQLKEFFSFLKTSRIRQFNYFLTAVIFLLLPVKNSYIDLEISRQKPLIREIKLTLPEFSFYPVKTGNAPLPSLTASSVIVIDLESKAIIYARNPDQQLLPASTTKIMTALVVLEHYQLNEILEVNNLKNIGRIMHLEEGEKITVKNLLYGLLVESGNDAAYVLAQGYPGGVGQFVKTMNDKAIELNLKNTRFNNPAGIDEADHLSTVHDLALLAVEAMKDEDFAQFVKTKKISVTDVEGKIIHDLENVNELLGEVEGIKGIKTGWTETAGECLVGYTERNGQGIVTVVLGSGDRFGETSKLIEWVFTNHQWQRPYTNLQ